VVAQIHIKPKASISISFHLTIVPLRSSINEKFALKAYDDEVEEGGVVGEVADELAVPSLEAVVLCGSGLSWVMGLTAYEAGVKPIGKGGNGSRSFASEATGS
jgi:hypothetical protein